MVLAKRGLGAGIVSQVPCLGNAIGIVRVKKRYAKYTTYFDPKVCLVARSASSK